MPGAKRPDPKPPEPPARWLTTRQAWDLVYATIGGPTWQTFREWANRHRPPGFPRPFRAFGRPGFTWDRDELNAWLADNGPEAAAARERPIVPSRRPIPSG